MAERDADRENHLTCLRSLRLSRSWRPNYRCPLISQWHNDVMSEIFERQVSERFESPFCRSAVVRWLQLLQPAEMELLDNIEGAKLNVSERRPAAITHAKHLTR